EAGAVCWWLRWLMLGAAVAAVVLIFGAQYASWNSPGSHNPIEGIEGRYFLPVAPLVALSFPPIWRLRAPVWYARTIGVALGTLSAVVCLWAVITRYYFP